MATSFMGTEKGEGILQLYGMISFRIKWKLWRIGD
jgi:hypothetical protein